jgi:hypothetical protein
MECARGYIVPADTSFMSDYREFVYRGPIRVSNTDLQAAKSRRKTCTIRKGLVDVSQHITRLQCRDESVRVRIDRVQKGLRFGELTVAHAKAEGFNTVCELQDDLRKYYRGLAGDTIMTAIWFHVLDDSASV